MSGSSSHSTPRPRPLAGLLAPYSWRAGQMPKEDVLDKEIFLWENQTGGREYMLAIWPEPENPPDIAWTEGETPVHEEEIRHETEATKEEGGNNLRGPLRLYDCENRVLKDQRTYLEETRGVVPPYLVVSQVWGEIKTFMTLPSVAWPVPISDEKKLDAIVDYCKHQRIKWLWLDILCINQSRSVEAETEKEGEIPKMSFYYRDAIACLVVPQNYETFSAAYSSVMDVVSRFVDTGASVQHNTKAIWDAMVSLETLLDDSWFWRVWTYQELLLPKKLVLLDGKELSIDNLERCVGWYLTILRFGMLQKPIGGRDYSWIIPGETGFTISYKKRWTALRLSWDVRPSLRRDGYLHILPVVMANSQKECRFPVDHILGVYGLLKEEDRLPTLREPNPHIQVGVPTVTGGGLSTQDDVGSGISFDDLSAHLSPSNQSIRLERLWERTVLKTVKEGRVWPLLFDAMVPSAPKGTNWLPRVVGAEGSEVHDVSDERNERGMIAVTEAGLHITARVVGRVTGTSAAIGDGTGELNKVFACAWTLVAKGFDPQPIIALMEGALARSEIVPREDVEDNQAQLRRALHAPSLIQCFMIVEKMKFRQKLVYSRGFTGWNRTLLTASPGPSYTGADGTYVFLGWVYSEKPADRERCWILDVTAGSPDARRWVIANEIGSNMFHKIGSVAASSHPAFATNHVYRRVILD